MKLKALISYLALKGDTWAISQIYLRIAVPFSPHFGSSDTGLLVKEKLNEAFGRKKRGRKTLMRPQNVHSI